MQNSESRCFLNNLAAPTSVISAVTFRGQTLLEVSEQTRMHLVVNVVLQQHGCQPIKPGLAADIFSPSNGLHEISRRKGPFFYASSGQLVQHSAPTRQHHRTISFRRAETRGNGRMYCPQLCPGRNDAILCADSQLSVRSGQAVPVLLR